MTFLRDFQISTQPKKGLVLETSPAKRGVVVALPWRSEFRSFQPGRVKFITMATWKTSCFIGLIEFGITGILFSKGIKNIFLGEVLCATVGVFCQLWSVWQMRLHFAREGSVGVFPVCRVGWLDGGWSEILF